MNSLADVDDNHSREEKDQPIVAQKSSARRGLTLTDVIVMVFALGVLVAILFPFILQSRERERRDLCEFRMEKAAEAVLEYEDAHTRMPGYRDLFDRNESDARLQNWAEAIRPYFDLQRHAATPTDTLAQAAAEHFEQLICPTAASAGLDQSSARISFVVNSGMPDAHTADAPPDWPANGVFLDLSHQHARAEHVSLKFIREHDGTSQTFMLTENVDAGEWRDTNEPRVGFVWMDTVVNGKPARSELLWGINQRTGEGDGTVTFARPSSQHDGGVNTAFCDGRTEFLAENIDYLVFTQMMTPHGKGARIPGTQTPVATPFCETADVTH